MNLATVKGLINGAVTPVKSAIAKVTPEQFGAKGDGITDDSEAVQAACDAGYEVRFEDNKTYYLASTVTIDHDVHLVGGKNTIIKTKTPSGGTVNDGIVITGTLKKTTTLTSNYEQNGSTANTGNQFTLSDMTDITIGDILIVEATDQYYSYARSYYYLGATLKVVDIYDGHLYTNISMPFDITNTENVTVKVYSAPTAIIENLDFVSDLDSRGNYKYCLELAYTKDSVIRHCNFTQMDNGATFRYCVNALIDNVSLSKSKYNNSLSGDGYGIVVFSSTHTKIQNVVALCAQGCVCFGGQIPNIDMFIYNCDLNSECRTTGMDMHENSYNIVIEDSNIGGIALFGKARVNRCRIIQNKRAGSCYFSVRGGALYSDFIINDCDLTDSVFIITRPEPQDPIQAFANVIDSIEITNCKGGRIDFSPTTTESVTENTVKSLVVNKWKNIRELYHTTGNTIEYLKIVDTPFGEMYGINSHTGSINLTGIKYMDYSRTEPYMHKIYCEKTVRADYAVLPENVQIDVSSNNNSAKFVVCGANLVSNNVDDYIIGSVTGSTGGTLTRTPATGTGLPVLTMDASGNPVYTQQANDKKYSFYPVGMFYVKEPSTITISGKVKNTGGTSGASFTPYIAIVDCATGLVVKRWSENAVQATAAGASFTLSYVSDENCCAMCYLYCNSPVQNAETTFEELAIAVSPLFVSPIATSEAYTANRRTGNGKISSVAGANNIMCSEATFSVKYGADLVDNPVW